MNKNKGGVLRSKEWVDHLIKLNSIPEVNSTDLMRRIIADGDYPAFSPPLFQTCPSLIFERQANALLWNDFWRRPINEQCDAFGIRPGLFNWLSNYYTGSMVLIREPKTHKAITTQIECQYVKLFPINEHYLHYMTSLTWFTGLSLEEQRKTNPFTRVCMIMNVGPGRFHLPVGRGAETSDNTIQPDKGWDPTGQKAIYARSYPERFWDKINPPGIEPKHRFTHSLVQAILNNQYLGITTREGVMARLMRLNNDWWDFRNGHTLNMLTEGLTEKEVETIAAALYCSKEEAYALFAQQRLKQFGIPSELTYTVP